MKKIPTLFVRDAEDRRYVTDEVTPGCEWVITGEGVATRKYDGTCMAKLEGIGWVARREVKPGKTPPPGFIEVDRDEATGKIVGWEPAQQSSFVKFWREAIEGKHADHPYGTYELCGPKINGNPEGFDRHALISHDRAAKVNLFESVSPDLGDMEFVFRTIRSWGWEGIVWHHPDGRMAKLKARDFPRPDQA
ncbi:hypothetical protein [Aeromicrobium sp. 9AM]|uniref:hypothetical protein n=1 Tax=Aeromicrobium sp. 9AM TaxID=2653126 RepID=UPI0012EFD2BA|nr:hypothetical protein [Aeromicrobium sp. 9AM]VXC07763.1 Mucin [Aeromicrobium sp. 9AM]